MDKSLTPGAEHLLVYLRRLKEVFDVCDEDSDGFILPEHLVRLGSRFGQNEQVRLTTENVSIIICKLFFTTLLIKIPRVTGDHYKLCFTRSLFFLALCVIPMTKGVNCFFCTNKAMV